MDSSLVIWSLFFNTLANVFDNISITSNSFPMASAISTIGSIFSLGAATNSIL